ncbi:MULTISPECIES: hypothetical protein [unclassified Bradyrhizobium]
MELGQAAELFDHRLKYRVFRRRRVQIVDVAGGFEALPKRREETDVVIMGIRDLRKQVRRLFPCEASFVDDPYQRPRSLRLVALGLSQRLDFLPCGLLAVRSRCDGITRNRGDLV